MEEGQIWWCTGRRGNDIIEAMDGAETLVHLHIVDNVGPWTYKEGFLWHRDILSGPVPR